jgi:hypothetical protein
MATKTLFFHGIKNNWWITYLFQTQAEYGYTLTLKDNITGVKYYSWNKPSYGGLDIKINNRTSGKFQYTGKNGNLVCIIECPDSNELDNTWSESIITSIEGGKGSQGIGRMYFSSFEDYGGEILYNNLLVFVKGSV